MSEEITTAGDRYCLRTPNGTLSMSGPTLTIDVAETVYRFEWSRRFGPAVLGKRGEILSKQPSERSPFWKAIGDWQKQGCWVRGEECVYEPIPKEDPDMVQVGKRTYVHKSIAKKLGIK